MSRHTVRHGRVLGVRFHKEVRVSTYRLPTGRDVSLVRFAMAGTYEGVLEGTPATASPHVLRGLPGRAARLLPPATPLVTVRPERTPLPGWLCVAELVSAEGVREKDPDFNSRLYVCWFTDRTEQAVDAMVGAALPHVDWDRHAADYDVMDF